MIPKLKSRKKRLKMKKREQEMSCASEGSFKFQNITEIEETSGLLGKKGIRLKVQYMLHTHVTAYSSVCKRTNSLMDLRALGSCF